MSLTRMRTSRRISSIGPRRDGLSRSASVCLRLLPLFFIVKPSSKPGVRNPGIGGVRPPAPIIASGAGGKGVAGSAVEADTRGRGTLMPHPGSQGPGQGTGRGASPGEGRAADPWRGPWAWAAASGGRRGPRAACRGQRGPERAEGAAWAAAEGRGGGRQALGGCWPPRGRPHRGVDAEAQRQVALPSKHPERAEGRSGSSERKEGSVAPCGIKSVSHPCPTSLPPGMPSPMGGRGMSIPRGGGIGMKSMGG